MTFLVSRLVTKEYAMGFSDTRYERQITFGGKLPDRAACEGWLRENGLEQDAFRVVEGDNRTATVRFSQPDRYEALRLLAKLADAAA